MRLNDEEYRGRVRKVEATAQRLRELGVKQFSIYSPHKLLALNYRHSGTYNTVVARQDESAHMENVAYDRCSGGGYSNLTIYLPDGLPFCGRRRWFSLAEIENCKEWFAVSAR